MTSSTIIEALVTYLSSYSGLPSGAPVWVDFLGSEVNEFSIVPLPGPKIIDEYLDGGTLNEFAFAFQSSRSTADNPARIASSGFYELLAAWLRSQTMADDLPDLGSGRTALSIEAVNCGFLAQQGQSGTGIYQIQCKLEYEEQP